MKALWAEKDIIPSQEQCSPQMALVLDVREKKPQNEGHPRRHS